MIVNYLKVAWRNLLRHPLFTLINIFGLSMGIAVAWIMGLYVADELSYDRFHTDAQRIYRVVHYAQWEGGNLQLAPTSAPLAPALEQEFPDVEATVRIVPEGGGSVRVGKTQMQVENVYFADARVFEVFTYPFLYGNPHTALSKPESIVLTRKLAESLFGDASRALNQTVTFSNDVTNLVTGVMEDIPARTHLTFSALRSLPAGYTSGWQNFSLYTYVLLKPGCQPEKLEARFPAFFDKYLRPEMGNVSYRMELQPLPSIHLHSHLDYEAGPNGTMRTIYIFMMVAALILGIACINYINLYTARSVIRVREVGVRKAIGSSRRQLIGQFLTESNLLTGVAMALALVWVSAAIPAVNQFAGKSLSMSSFGWPVTLAAVLVLLIGVGLVSGLYPALFLSGFQTISALRNQSEKPGRSVTLRKGLVVFQFAIAVVLMVSVGVMYQQLRYARNKDLGFNKAQVLTFHIENEEVRQQMGALRQQLLQSPLVEAVAVAGNPIGVNALGGGGMYLEQNTGVMPASTQIVQQLSADAWFVPTLQIKVVNGRNFSTDRPTDWKEAVLVNESLVKRMGWTDPIGKRVQYLDAPYAMRVVGVVKDFHIYSLQHQIEPLIIQMPFPKEQDNVYVRIQPRETAQTLAFIEKTYKKFDPTARLEFHFLDQNFASQYQTEQKQGQLLLIWSALAILIACLGLFGLTAFSAERRTKEIGIRKVLGATERQIIWLVSKDFLKLVGIAFVVAVPVAWYAMQQWLQDFAYRIEMSWEVFVLAGMLALLIAVLTVSFQAIKAALANPARSLRTE